MYIVGVWDDIYWDHLPSALSKMMKAPKMHVVCWGNPPSEP